PEVHVFEGRVASGDQFVSSAEAKKRIVSNFGALCCEMEGAAVAHVAWLNNVPYVVIRAISDKADGSAHMDYPTFVAQAADRSASIIEHLVAQL
ncbi:MAG: 5'-methylthioadenosine/S-adenosylhomocysteine nucleosidase, partial [Atopobiaceae bacterium]|nr:5'-methylthioadenosine/S-adenosylhomocysteine nucleosidase [Atopobiaceae bacterium]